MRAKPKLCYIVYTLLILCNLSYLHSNNASALNYQSQTGLSFTFNPTINISISSDLTIPNLVPSSTEDSNVINIAVATNTSHGYTVSVLVDNSNLTHTNNVNTFTSIATNADLIDFSSSLDNTWGYSYKLSNSSNANGVWSNYNGLSTETSKTLFNTDNVTNSTIDFKIAAKASSAQPSGIYTNTINFVAVAKPTPQTIEDLTYLQGFASLLPTDLQSVKNSMPMNYTYTLKDQRDEQEYTIAKLADGKIWMTKNLNLAGGTEITPALSDIPEGYTLPVANGFQTGNRLPESSSPQTGFTDNTQAYVSNSNSSNIICGEENPCFSYYSYHAATAGSGVNIIADNVDAPYSICPKGWRLPNSRSSIEGDSDFYQLAIAYGANPSDVHDFSDTTGGNFYNNAGPGTTANFQLSGYYRNAWFNYGNNNGGFCWSSTSFSSTFARDLRFTETFVKADDNYRSDGNPVRCLAR